MTAVVQKTALTGCLAPIDRQGLEQLIVNGKANPKVIKTLKCKTVAEGKFRHANYIRNLPPYIVDEPPGLLGDDTAPNPSEASLAALGSTVSGLGENLQRCRGNLDALGGRVAALQAQAARLAAAAVVDAAGQTVNLASLQAEWRQQTARLLAPARISFADGVTIDNLRLGLRQAVLQVSGRAGAALDPAGHR